MIQWEYYRSGDLFLVKYYFHERGDALPEHCHGKEEAHNVMVIQGLVEISVGDVTYIASPSAMVDFDWTKPHKVTAIHPRSITLHGYLYGRPRWYDGLPTSGTFPCSTAEATAHSPGVERQGPFSNLGSDEPHLR